MKTLANMRYAIACLVILTGTFGMAFAKPKKAKLRMSVDYVKVMGESSMIQVKAKAKGDDGMQEVEHVEIKVFREYEDTSILITTIHTDRKGEAFFDISLDKTSIADTLNTVTYEFKAKAGEWYKASSKSVTYIDSDLNAYLETEDSTVYIVAQLKETKSGLPIEGEPIKVRVKRLFTPLTIGKDLYYTDEEGMIRVKYEDDIPGKHGVLDFNIILFESSDYGTVTHKLRTDLGKPVVMESTFHERTMWSPPNRTPLWLLIFPNLIILGIWFTIIKLAYNLIRISKIKA